MKEIITTILVTLSIDAVWLFSMKNVYDKWMSGFERTVNWPAVGLVYLAIPIGLFYFVISRHINTGLTPKAVMDAFLYGVFTYSVYDLTNLATLKGWSPLMTTVDIIWGGLLCSLATIGVLLILSRI